MYSTSMNNADCLFPWDVLRHGTSEISLTRPRLRSYVENTSIGRNRERRCPAAPPAQIAHSSILERRVQIEHVVVVEHHVRTHLVPAK
jgi:hypothetical protein